VAYREPVRTAPGTRVAALFAVAVAIAAALGSVSPSPPSAAPTHRSHHRPRAALGEAGGAVPAGTTVFDDGVPAVANLDPALRRALRSAATDAAADGVHIEVNGGWRSAAYEDRLRRAAIERYGSEAEAARWVATGSTSLHVAGKAVDLGPAGATPWLSVHGAAYGLCRTYANEPWHYELRPDAAAHGCPAMYADPTQDPRLRR
jgi:D-alanyl-D-alanine carboxypeptidase